ncbi:hypothetical protein RYX45_01540 [Alkalihalophilus pseudofirmus]|uniref:Uncharacterized protein n=1 Tax=Alkalihalophilus pseudofirmus TaxID=79885 RepID=A0AAJ2KV68_ALKPS|nr:hypothetical protein [Alkalihalophilus pseudofirmus]MDV2883846.1 hypothetical protein [Alkalihalophilus pseudofirmus]
MEYQVASEIAQSQYVFAILFILLAVGVFYEMRKEIRENRVDSKKREQQLMEHLRRSNESQERTAEALEGLENRIEKIERRVYREQGL